MCAGYSGYYNHAELACISAVAFIGLRSNSSGSAKLDRCKEGAAASKEWSSPFVSLAVLFAVAIDGLGMVRLNRWTNSGRANASPGFYRRNQELTQWDCAYSSRSTRHVRHVSATGLGLRLARNRSGFNPLAEQNVRAADIPERFLASF